MRHTAAYAKVDHAALSALARPCAAAEAAGADTVTAPLAVQWATQPPGGSVTWHGRRLSVLRCFARWRQAIDPATEVPPADILLVHTRRVTPYLYSETDIADLMAVAERLPSPLAAATMHTFICLVHSG